MWQNTCFCDRNRCCLCLIRLVFIYSGLHDLTSLKAIGSAGTLGMLDNSAGIMGSLPTSSKTPKQFYQTLRDSKSDSICDNRDKAKVRSARGETSCPTRRSMPSVSSERLLNLLVNAFPTLIKGHLIKPLHMSKARFCLVTSSMLEATANPDAASSIWLEVLPPAQILCSSATFTASHPRPRWWNASGR